MKKILFFIAMTMCFMTANSQERLSYSQVITKEGKTAKDLYELSKNWMLTYYRSAKDVMQYDDAEHFTINGRGKSVYGCQNIAYGRTSGFFDYNLKVECRDGRLKISITDIEHRAGFDGNFSIGIIYQGTEDNIGDVLKDVKYSNKAMAKYVHKRAFEQMPGVFADIVKSLTSYIDKGAKENDDDKW